jgi:myo-inositol-1(or 4)-monophosphatase
LRAPEPTIRGALADELAIIVREAGALAKSFRGENLKFWTKHGDSPVSEADLAVDKMLRERLTRLMPDAAWLSEETEDDRARLGAARLWVVDPIDGTRAYVHGRTDWSVAVALVEHGRPIAGAVYAPMEDGLYLATAGAGATLDGVALAVSRVETFDHARAAGPKPMLAKLAEHAPTLVALPKIHSLALRLARVASAKLDVAFASNDSHDWDIAAADIIVHEAGGTLTTLAGDPLVYNSRDARHGALVAAGPGRHARAVAMTRTWWR